MMPELLLFETLHSSLEWEHLLWKNAVCVWTNEGPRVN